MEALTLKGWRKAPGEEQSRELGNIRFLIDELHHRLLEEAEEKLQHTGGEDALVDVDRRVLSLELPPGCSALADCRFRVYLDPANERGHFHLVGHSFDDGSLVYTNAVMIDQLE